MTEALSNAVAGIIATLAACSWLGRNAIQDDADTHACHELVLDSLSDADLVTKIDTVTESNLRDQLTVGDAMTLYEEAQLSKFGTRRN
jgi:hypothetical protein